MATSNDLGGVIIVITFKLFLCLKLANGLLMNCDKISAFHHSHSALHCPLGTLSLKSLLAALAALSIQVRGVAFSLVDVWRLTSSKHSALVRLVTTVGPILFWKYNNNKSFSYSWCLEGWCYAMLSHGITKLKCLKKYVDVVAQALELPYLLKPIMPSGVDCVNINE